jgi:hypothetical protein
VASNIVRKFPRGLAGIIEWLEAMLKMIDLLRAVNGAFLLHAAEPVLSRAEKEFL